MAVVPVGLGLVPASSSAVSSTDTRLLSQPAISKNNVAFVYAGDLWIAGIDGNDVRRLTTVEGVSNPAFSPDGRSMAYFSDASGGYQLVVEAQDGKGEPRNHKLTGTGFYQRPARSPDSRKIAHTDNSWSVYWRDCRERTMRLRTAAIG